MVGWHRLLAGVGLALAGLALAGCRAQGTFDILSDDQVSVDLTVTDTEIVCPRELDALKLTIVRTTDPSGAPACHVTGTTQATYFSPFGIDISSAAEYLVLQASISGGRDSWPPADITIRFPGDVVQSNQGTVAGNTVRITDLGPVAEGSGLRVVALGRPGPAAWVLGVLAGVAGGVAAALIVVFGRRLLRGFTPDGPASIPVGQGAAGDEPGAARTAAAGVLIDSDSTAGMGSRPPGAGPPDELFAPGPEDTSWFAGPPVESVQPVAASPWSEHRAGGGARGRHPQPDHSVWAPPEDE